MPVIMAGERELQLPDEEKGEQSVCVWDGVNCVEAVRGR